MDAQFYFVYSYLKQNLAIRITVRPTITTDIGNIRQFGKKFVMSIYFLPL